MSSFAAVYCNVIDPLENEIYASQLLTVPTLNPCWPDYSYPLPQCICHAGRPWRGASWGCAAWEVRVCHFQHQEVGLSLQAQQAEGQARPGCHRRIGWGLAWPWHRISSCPYPWSSALCGLWKKIKQREKNWNLIALKHVRIYIAGNIFFWLMIQCNICHFLLISRIISCIHKYL